MKRGRLPLTALRSFEAAGRLESFTLAAAELFVSQAAISRQIRDLEQQLGAALFERQHRGVRLTRRGADLLLVLTDAFDRMEHALTGIAPPTETRTLTVNSEPSFAACWLVPHLSEFRALWPDIEVTIESDPRMIEFRTRDADLAIRHSLTEREWPRTEAQFLFESLMIPVASPALATSKDPLSHTLLHEENRSLWGQWFDESGLSHPATTRGPVFADGGQVLQAALRGHGVAMLDHVFAAEDLKAGRLIQPFDHAIRYGAYWLVTPDFRPVSQAAHAFAAWLLGHAAFGASGGM